DEGVVDLVRHVARVPVPFGYGQRLHQLPAGEVRDPDIAHFPGAHQGIEGGQHLLDRRTSVEGMELEQVDVIGAESTERGLAGLDQAGPGRASVMWAVTGGQAGLGGEEYLVPSAFDRRTQDFL